MVTLPTYLPTYLPKARLMCFRLFVSYIVSRDSVYLLEVLGAFFLDYV